MNTAFWVGFAFLIIGLIVLAASIAWTMGQSSLSMGSVIGAWVGMIILLIALIVVWYNAYYYIPVLI